MSTAGRTDGQARGALGKMLIALLIYLALTLTLYPVIAYGTHGAINVSPYRYFFVASFLSLIASLVIRGVASGDLVNYLILTSLLATAALAFADEAYIITSRHVSVTVLPFIIVLHGHGREAVAVDLGQVLALAAVVPAVIMWRRKGRSGSREARAGIKEGVEEVQN